MADIFKIDSDGNVDAAGDIAYVDRGDPSGNDYEVGDFTTDGTWRDLDLSSIVPAGAKAVLLLLALEDDVAEKSFFFRKKGNSNNYNSDGAYTQVADVTIRSSVVVACDTDRKVEYMGSNTTFTKINVVVGGWWL